MRLLLLLILLAGGCSAGGVSTMLTPTRLRCEYHVNPIGIDSERPRFDWRLISDQRELRGQKQSAYQILVASSEANLQKGRGDLWDSGVVKSDDT